MSQSETRHEIRDLVDRYAISLDRRDRDGLAALFTEDVTADYDGTLVAPGRAALLDYLGQLANFADSLHHLGPLTVVDEPDGTVDVVVNALVVAIPDGTGSVPALLRSLRYRFTVSGPAGSRRIRSVRHRCLWQSDLLMSADFSRRSFQDRP